MKTKTIKAWIHIKLKANPIFDIPGVNHFEPSPLEIKTSKEHGFAFYPCVISYNDDEKMI